MSTLPVAIAVAVPAFLAMVPIAWLAYRFVEAPFQRLKPCYLRTPGLRPAPARVAQTRRLAAALPD
jgi:peptidoglycan/LPS O-acetylase OafA/YrhL